MSLKKKKLKIIKKKNKKVEFKLMMNSFIINASFI